MDTVLIIIHYRHRHVHHRVRHRILIPPRQGSNHLPQLPTQIFIHLQLLPQTRYLMIPLIKTTRTKTISRPLLTNHKLPWMHWTHLWLLFLLLHYYLTRWKIQLRRKYTTSINTRCHRPTSISRHLKLEIRILVVLLKQKQKTSTLPSNAQPTVIHSCHWVGQVLHNYRPQQRILLKLPS